MTALRRCAALLVAALLLAMPALAQEAGQSDLERGEALMEAGEFEKALEAFRAAAEASPEDAGARERALIAQRIVMVRRIAADESDPRWARAVGLLHGFYLGNGLAEHAEPLDRRRHEKEQSRQSGGALAETLAVLEKYNEALSVLNSLLEKGADPMLWVQRAMVLIRLERPEDARASLAKTPDELSGREELYGRACAYALLGDAARASADLKRVFELTPPSMLAAVKDFAKDDEDLGALHGTPGWEEALAAASKVPEPSACGGCAGCPSSGSCDKQQENEEQGGCPSGGSCPSEGGQP